MTLEFAEVVRAAQQRMGRDDLDMSRLLKVSRPTIERWLGGVSEPHPLGQAVIFATLGTKL